MSVWDRLRYSAEKTSPFAESVSNLKNPLYDNNFGRAVTAMREAAARGEGLEKEVALMREQLANAEQHCDDADSLAEMWEERAELMEKLLIESATVFGLDSNTKSDNHRIMRKIDALRASKPESQTPSEDGFKVFYVRGQRSDGSSIASSMEIRVPETMTFKEAQQYIVSKVSDSLTHYFAGECARGCGFYDK